MSVITICNHKGGTGKTTTTIHLAAALCRMGARVLVVDLDPQGFLTHALELDEPHPSKSSLALLSADSTLSGIPAQRASGFSVIGASPAMIKAMRELTSPLDVLRLRETFRKGYAYDIILVDTPAALSVYPMNAMAAADGVVIPVTPEYQPVVGGEQTWHTTSLVREKLNPGLRGSLILLTQVDGRLNRHAEYSQYLRNEYGGSVMQTEIRTSSALADSCVRGRTVFDTRPSVRGARDYRSAAVEISRRWFSTSPWFLKAEAKAPPAGLAHEGADHDEPDTPPLAAPQAAAT